MVDRQTFYVENAVGREPETVLEEFLLEYYWEAAAIPPEIILDLDESAPAAAALLSARRGKAVVVKRAQRGPKRRLLEMARNNAALAGAAEEERLLRRRQTRIESLEGLRDALGLESLPLRIECYDISNLGEQHAVGSMVVFVSGLPKKSHYRKFAVRDVVGQDDFAMMNEVIARRFERGALIERGETEFDESFAATPDLIVVDGGKGQLSAACEALAAAGVRVPIVGLAKQHEEVFVPGKSAPLPVPADAAASLLLQRVRDEAHRFAVTFHRRRRDADLLKASIFDGLTQVGSVRRRRILEHFGSPERFVAASCEELESVPGLPKKVARDIHAQLHKAG